MPDAAFLAIPCDANPHIVRDETVLDAANVASVQ
jgi:hypothetical protein